MLVGLAGGGLSLEEGFVKVLLGSGDIRAFFLEASFRSKIVALSSAFYT